MSFELRGPPAHTGFQCPSAIAQYLYPGPVVHSLCPDFSCPLGSAFSLCYMSNITKYHILGRLSCVSCFQICAVRGLSLLPSLLLLPLSPLSFLTPSEFSMPYDPLQASSGNLQEWR